MHLTWLHRSNTWRTTSFWTAFSLVGCVVAAIALINMFGGLPQTSIANILGYTVLTAICVTPAVPILTIACTMKPLPPLSDSSILASMLAKGFRAALKVGGFVALTYSALLAGSLLANPNPSVDALASFLSQMISITLSALTVIIYYCWIRLCVETRRVDARSRRAASNRIAHEIAPPRSIRRRVFLRVWHGRAPSLMSFVASCTLPPLILVVLLSEVAAAVAGQIR